MKKQSQTRGVCRVVRIRSQAEAKTGAARAIAAAPAAAPVLHRVATYPGTPDELVLLDGLIANDGRAWREFALRYESLIQRCIGKVVRRFASRVTVDDAQEIYAQFIVSLLANDKHKLRSFDPTRGNRLSSWIGLLAMNAAYDYLRAVRREPRKATLPEAFEIASEGMDPFELTVERERAGLAEQLLRDFSERDRTFATLYFGEGMDPLEIATQMKISVKTVYSKKHKIQSKLELLATRAA